MCEQIREDPENRETPVIFLTAKNDSESIVRGFELGAMDYVTKPFNGLELIARVETHLNLYRSKQELQKAYQQLKHEIGERIKVEAELRRSEERYRFLSDHDDLTGLYNTRYFYRALEGLIGECTDGQGQFSLIFMDMDNFKRVVDTHGHLNGSRALAEVAVTIRSCLTEADDQKAYGVAYGGDEFVVVLPGCNKSQALAKAEQIRMGMKATPYLPHIQAGISLRASFGVSTYPEDADNLTGILAKADQAMFHVKAKGKNAVGSAG